MCRESFFDTFDPHWLIRTAAHRKGEFTARPTPVPTASPAPSANQAAPNAVTVGEGTASSSSGGIDYGPACSASFDVGSTVTLTAAPAEGFKFKRWIGAGCKGKKLCTIELNQSKTVKAKFVRKRQ